MKFRFQIAAAALCLAACHNSGKVVPDARDPSVARQWNEMLLSAISRDLARPTVHARNLWHTSAAMYDAWAAYDDIASTWLLGRSQNGHFCDFARRTQYRRSPVARDTQVARETAISYAAYRIILHRFQNTPRFAEIAADADALMAALGYDTGFTDSASGDESPAALGNHIAECYIAYGMDDGSNEANNYASVVYQPANLPIEPE
jgi:hypothetical protein